MVCMPPCILFRLWWNGTWWKALSFLAIRDCLPYWKKTAITTFSLWRMKGSMIIWTLSFGRTAMMKCFHKKTIRLIRLWIALECRMISCMTMQFRYWISGLPPDNRFLLLYCPSVIIRRMWYLLSSIRKRVNPRRRLLSTRIGLCVSFLKRHVNSPGLIIRYLCWKEIMANWWETPNVSCRNLITISRWWFTPAVFIRKRKTLLEVR